MDNLLETDAEGSEEPSRADVSAATPARGRKVFIKTFGCQMNVYDSERMSEALAGNGYSETGRIEEADLVILNTCHIREKAAEKVYSDLGRVRVAKEERKATGRDTMVAVVGCVAQAEGAEIVARAPVVDRGLGAHPGGSCTSHAAGGGRALRGGCRQPRTGHPRG